MTLFSSNDSKWLAFSVHPTEKEAVALRKQHKPVEDKAVLVELATQKKNEFEKVKRFSFSGERSSAIALHRYGLAGPEPAPNPSAEDKPSDDKPQGSDLLLMDLASGTELSLGNVSDFAFDKQGKWLAWVVDAQDKLGNGIELRNMTTGSVMALDTAKATYKSLNWTEKGDGLAVFRGTDDKQWEDKLYSLLAFKNFQESSAPDKYTFEPAKDSSFPGGMTISPDRRPNWMADLATVTFGIRELKPKPAKETEAAGNKKKEDTETLPDLVIWNWKDRRLQSMQQVQENRDKRFSYLCSWRPGGQKFYRLADEGVRDVSLTPEGEVRHRE